ncbi:MAG: SPASM domain-containing protein [Eubacteriaceae bacterium]|nr:SPASM domain-containing protein [Eubacteriaceae bacterium]
MLRKLYIEPTNKCNLNCKMCFRNTWFDEAICEMTLEEYKYVLESMPHTVEKIFFGGMGEPMVHKDIFEMISLASHKCEEVELITNGTLLNEQTITSLIDSGLTKLWISIDDLDTENPTLYSGHDNSSSVLNGIRLFNRIRQIKMTGVGLGITFVATRSNVHQLAKLPFFTAQYLIDEVNISNISPTDEDSKDEMLYRNMVNMFTGPAKGNVLPKVNIPYFDMSIPEAADGIRELMIKQNFEMFFNDQRVMRRTSYCKFVSEGMCFVRSDGNVSPCMALLHNGYTYLNDVKRTIHYATFGNAKETPLSDIWNSEEYRAFRKKVIDFDFSPCIYCGHCDLFEENNEDCIGNTHPTCGGCLWAEGVLSCP